MLCLETKETPIFLAGTAFALTYTPTNGYTGADSFTFTVSDGVYTSPLATVTIQVNAAGSIAWTAAKNITNTNDVSTNGTPVWAYNFGTNENSVINGVTFIGMSSPTGNVSVMTDLTGWMVPQGSSNSRFSRINFPKTMPGHYPKKI